MGSRHRPELVHFCRGHVSRRGSVLLSQKGLLRQTTELSVVQQHIQYPPGLEAIRREGAGAGPLPGSLAHRGWGSHYGRPHCYAPRSHALRNVFGRVSNRRGASWYTGCMPLVRCGHASAWCVPRRGQHRGTRACGPVGAGPWMTLNCEAKRDWIKNETKHPSARYP